MLQAKPISVILLAVVSLLVVAGLANIPLAPATQNLCLWVAAALVVMVMAIEHKNQAPSHPVSLHGIILLLRAVYRHLKPAHRKMLATILVTGALAITAACISLMLDTGTLTLGSQQNAGWQSLLCRAIAIMLAGVTWLNVMRTNRKARHPN